MNHWFGLHRKKVISIIKFYIFKFAFFKISHEIPADFMDEICQISPWNLLDFMKSARFHHEIHRISWSTTECCIFHQNQYRYTLLAHLGCKNANLHGSEPIQIYIMSLLHAKYVVYSPCHEIHQISWNPPDFMSMKSAGFHLAMKSAGFHEIRCISWCQMSQGPMVYFLGSHHV